MTANMRKLDISSYIVQVVNPATNLIGDAPYGVVKTIGMILCDSNENQRLSNTELLKRYQVLTKIERAEKDEQTFILLQENEWQMIDKAFDAFKGYRRNEVIIVQRVKDCPTVPVEETESE